MISTFFGQDTLSSAQAMLAALLIGVAFGFALERAGFGSSRRLAGIFYFRDMAVLKVMFTAVVVAMLGLLYARGLGWISEEQLFFMPSIYGAQIVGGLVFGVGFVVAGWCPGTAAVGVASGRWDALVFLGGATVGSILFNEMFGAVKGLYTWGASGVQFAWQNVGMSSAGFAFLFVLVAIGCFWGSEYIERRRGAGGAYFNSPFLKAFSVALIVLAGGLMILHGAGTEAPAAAAPAMPQSSEVAILATVEAAQDHIEPEDLADRLMAGEKGLLLVDIRPAEEFEAFHLRGAVNIALTDLPAALAPHKNVGLIVLYSNGMTHPAQARDSLARMGFGNVYILTDGLQGFVDRCLKPVSLHLEPLSAAQATKVNAWRWHFYGQPASLAAQPTTLPISKPVPPTLPGLVEPAWLAENLGKTDLRILDVREQPRFNTSHLPGSVCVSPENFRGVVNGVSAMLLPPDILARHMSLMGIKPTDTIVIVPEDKLVDATLVAIAMARLGHAKYGILNGGFARWQAEKLPVTTQIPEMAESQYPVPQSPDPFTLGYKQILDHVKKGDALIIDVRPAEFYTGKKVEEARGGHIPGSKNRPFTEDVTKIGNVTLFKSTEDLAKAYSQLIPSKDATVIVHCRTGHQASQAFFVLRNLLGYKNVLWYDAGWSEWAARSELPAVQETDGK
jgi:thiosulfate/3-mercaptopyruvate sulfurtransferase